MENPSPNYLFATRERIRRWKSLAGIFHLLTVAGLVLALLSIFPRLLAHTPLELGEQLREAQARRQLVLEALDKIVRYEKYYVETHGRYTRDLARLRLPSHFASGARGELEQAYEISVLEAEPNRILILATGLGHSDRVTIDESYRLSANFVLPPPSRALLGEEAERLLRVRALGGRPEEGIYSRYWKVEERTEGGVSTWVAIGARAPILGERREWNAERPGPSVFTAVTDQIQQRLLGERRPAAVSAPQSATKPDGIFPEVLAAQAVREWLEAARFAQRVFHQEKGRYARRWEELDEVSDFHFGERMRVAKNVRVHPIELAGDGFQLTVEGTDGDLLGERFVVDQRGTIRQVRYTEALIQQLQEGTNLLENTFHFQINPITDDGKARP